MKLLNVINLIKECKTLGKGYTENIYQEAICSLLRRENISYSKEPVFPITFNDVNIGFVRGDIFIKEKDFELIIECKALASNLNPSQYFQLENYLKINKCKNGIMVNFNQNHTKDLIDFKDNFVVMNYNVNDDKITFVKNIENLNYFITEFPLKPVDD